MVIAFDYKTLLDRHKDIKLRRSTKSTGRARTMIDEFSRRQLGNRIHRNLAHFSSPYLLSSAAINIFDVLVQLIGSNVCLTFSKFTTQGRRW